MPQVISIDSDDITYAERVLLPEGKTFDEDERRAFIRNLNVIDLQAVPGSGKTTALLAKLLIIERKLPFEDGSGVLVLSHTNAAIDEIKNKIQRHCPKLFSYPNYIGTIQSFVDEFIAIPFYINTFKSKPYRIDNEIYDEQVEWFYNNTPNVGLKNWLNRKYDGLGFLKYLRFDVDYNLISSLESTVQDFELKDKTASTYTALHTFKTNLLKKGYLHYDDAYTLANIHIKNVPSFCSLLQKRFGYVFVDEMQDMDTHQYDLLEKIFYNGGNSITKYQRIGDKNQAIYNSVKAHQIWVDRPEILRLNGSQRLSSRIANIVQKFALHTDDNFNIVGLNGADIKPHILVFKNETLGNVIPHFGSLVSAFKESGHLINFDRYPVKVVAWNTEWKTQEDKDDVAKLRLVDFHTTYSKNEKGQKQDYPYLKSHLLYFDKTKQTLESIRKSVLNSFLKILRLENVYNEKGRYYTKKEILEFIKDSDTLKYDTIKLNLYNWSIGIIRGQVDTVWNEIKSYIPEFLLIFSTQELSASLSFINTDVTYIEVENQEPQKNGLNSFKTESCDIEITSVHAVKGQTHCATLYLESFYDGQYEPLTLSEAFKEKSSNQLIIELKTEIDRLTNELNTLNGGRGTKTRETQIKSHNNKINLIAQVTKMAYVGFSRPTNLLCVAIHEDRFNECLSEINKDEWEIVNVS